MKELNKVRDLYASMGYTTTFCESNRTLTVVAPYGETKTLKADYSCGTWYVKESEI